MKILIGLGSIWFAGWVLTFIGSAAVTVLTDFGTPLHLKAFNWLGISFVAFMCSILLLSLLGLLGCMVFEAINE